MKLYYTDPLKAAYMAEEFSIRFKYWKWSQRRFQFLSTIEGDDKPSDKLYIREGSYSDIKPQYHDELTDNAGGFYYVWENEAYIKQAEKLIQDKGYKIAQRNGKPFFCPEEEV